MRPPSYIDRLAYETDVWLSVATGGPEDETVSLRTARAAANGGRLACLFCRWLSLTVERDHCTKQLRGTVTKPAGAVRAAVQFALAIGMIVLFWHFVL